MDFRCGRESGFRDRESAVVKDFASRDNVVIATGGGVVLRPENRIVMSNASTVVYLEASLSTLVSRTEGKTKRPLLVGKDVRKVLQEIMAVREPSIAKLRMSRSHQPVVLLKSSQGDRGKTYSFQKG